VMGSSPTCGANLCKRSLKLAPRPFLLCHVPSGNNLDSRVCIQQLAQLNAVEPLSPLAYKFVESIFVELIKPILEPTLLCLESPIASSLSLF
jgi:hypothetical protein